MMCVTGPADATWPGPRRPRRARAGRHHGRPFGHGLHDLVMRGAGRPGDSGPPYSRPIQVATPASLPSASASVHHAGACSSLTSRPPAASATAARASAWSCGTEMSMWIRFRCGRGASIASNQNDGPLRCGSSRSSSPTPDNQSTARQKGVGPRRGPAHRPGGRRPEEAEGSGRKRDEAELPPRRWGMRPGPRMFPRP